MADPFMQIVDNSQQVLEEFNKQVMNGLNAIGLKAEKHAKANCPVDTGRLHNSITFATASYHSPGNTYKPTNTKSPPKDAQPGDYATKGTPEQLDVYIGTNVEYARAVEEHDRHHTSGRAHFLRDAAAAHGDEYRDTMRAALETDADVGVSGEMVNVPE